MDRVGREGREGRVLVIIFGGRGCMCMYERYVILGLPFEIHKTILIKMSWSLVDFF